MAKLTDEELAYCEKRMFGVLQGAVEAMIERSETMFPGQTGIALQSTIIACLYRFAGMRLIATTAVSLGVDRKMEPATMEDELDILTEKVTVMLEDYNKGLRERLAKGN